MERSTRNGRGRARRWPARRALGAAPQCRTPPKRGRRGSSRGCRAQAAMAKLCACDLEVSAPGRCGHRAVGSAHRRSPGVPSPGSAHCQRCGATSPPSLWPGVCVPLNEVGEYNHLKEIATATSELRFGQVFRPGRAEACGRRAWRRPKPHWPGPERLGSQRQGGVLGLVPLSQPQDVIAGAKPTHLISFLSRYQMISVIYHMMFIDISSFSSHQGRA